jgi:hypothetical protein
MMTWVIREGIEVETVDVDDARIVEISLLSQASVQNFCVGLSMLWTEVANSFVVGKHRMANVSMHARVGETRCVACVEWKRERVNLVLSATDVEHWLCFALKAVRDGVAEVDHLDLEFIPSNAKERRGSVVVKFPVVMAAVSASEARRRLGLPPSDT